LWHSERGFGDETEVARMPNNAIVILLQGKVECVKGGGTGRRGIARADLVTVLRKGDPGLYVSPNECRFAHLYFEDTFWRSLADDALTRQASGVELLGDRVFASDRELHGLVHVYLTRAFDRVTPSVLEMDSRANLIVLSLIRRHSSLSPKPEVQPMALAPHRLSRVKDYLEAHLAEDLNLAEIAGVAGLSPFHFARAFKCDMGVPPHRYLMTRRVERARELLAGTGLGLAEVAMMCGFAGQSHFTTAFKRHTGVTPSAWRAAVRS
jgi:AraC family transcriptional regulator